VLSTGLVTIAVWSEPVHRAVLLMAWGTILLWVFGFGTVSVILGRKVAGWITGWRLPWPVGFVAACTLLAMLEELVTTGMTNMATSFGVQIGKAYVTASTNYFDVILFHSVCLFVSFFVAWALMLRKISFAAWQVFLLFGITGTIAEASFGPQHLMEFALWIPVYGLMVYVPALATEGKPGRAMPRWWHFPLSVFLPFPFIVLFPMAGLIRLFDLGHPAVHFPPIR
jgi:hypothetical protein